MELEELVVQTEVGLARVQEGCHLSGTLLTLDGRSPTSTLQGEVTVPRRLALRTQRGRTDTLPVPDTVEEGSGRPPYVGPVPLRTCLPP